MAPKGQATKAPAKQESIGAALARRARAQIRFLIALAVGVAVALLAPFDERIPRVLAGWNAGGWLYLVLVAIKMWRAEIDGIKREASIERESRIVVLVVVTLGSIFTMLALFAQLMALKSEHGLDRTLSVGLSVSTIFLSWLLIHTVFALYYAHEFHSEAKGRSRGQGGGLSFPDDSTPDYLDFLYFSFVVGTTAQTSDVVVCSRAMRRVVMLHGILSFFFNTAVIALAVNIAAQLVQG
ncbi:MAG TPA: DUF1345 domain-containing protein [Rhizobiales bacterium]|jgi:uncharacterized membrane protein|nr:DUF1345 domain-containing protein [Hyphomicrobiales bacterium]HAN64364.1 DUF1345 domain-containing protein [Hyphomicrobiales bacterium]HBH40470.1 DUF1345 domain-containing protein [Hyphomicrobiales bacterium]HBR26306.1 DUF1345 domain-containing protein [Hyphomicrobiales bacterium]HCL62576.1 DUF1345 domain-containing protein [Hyphomicrobiales bacterium]